MFNFKVLSKKSPLSEGKELSFQEKSWGGFAPVVDPISWEGMNASQPQFEAASSFEVRLRKIWWESLSDEYSPEGKVVTYTPTVEEWESILSRERALASLQKESKRLGVGSPHPKKMFFWGVTSRKLEGFITLYRKIEGGGKVGDRTAKGLLSLVGRKFDHQHGWVLRAVAWRQGLTERPFEGTQVGIGDAAKVWHLQQKLNCKLPIPRRIAEHVGKLPLHRRMEAAEIAKSMEENWDVEEFWKRLSSSKRNSREVIATFPGWSQSHRLRKIFKGTLPKMFLEFAGEYPQIDCVGMLMVKGVKVSLIQKVETSKEVSDWDYCDDLHKEFLLKLYFGVDWKKSLNLQGIGGRDMHDLSNILGRRRKPFNPREKDVLPLILGKTNSLYKGIELVEKCPLDLPLSEVGNWVDEILVSHVYPSSIHRGFATEAMKWQLKEADYGKWEERFLSSHEVASPFPTDKVFGENGLKGYFLKREDVRGVFLGEYTNCCQHPGGAGSACAKHGQESPDGGFFVVEDKDGKIIAQSWVWTDNMVELSGVCFDNIETLTLGSRMEMVERIYRDAAQALYGLGFEFVTLGRGDLEFGAFTSVRLSPSEYEGYRDSKRQTLIEKEELLDI